MAKKKGHFLPKFYLGGFTPSGQRDDQLQVFSKYQNKHWHTQAQEVGHERYLFRAEGAEFDPDEFEDAFSVVEGRIAPLLATVASTTTLPAGEEDLDILLHLVALNASRPPAEMARIQEIVDKTARHVLIDEVTRERHEEILNIWRASGKDTTEIEDLEAWKTRVREGSVRVEMQRDYFLISGVMGRAAQLVDILSQRDWILLEAGEGLEFICSDRPVSLLNNQPMPRVDHPRYDDKRYDVVMPLSRKLCLIGHCRGFKGKAMAGQETVGFINRITQTGAAGYVYSAQPSYAVATEEDLREAGEAYLNDLKKSARIK